MVLEHDVCTLLFSKYDSCALLPLEMACFLAV